MHMSEWKDEMLGDAADLVETEWDAELGRRLEDVTGGGVDLLDHAESMRNARERLVANRGRRDVA